MPRDYLPRFTLGSGAQHALKHAGGQTIPERSGTLKRVSGELDCFPTLGVRRRLAAAIVEDRDAWRSYHL